MSNINIGRVMLGGLLAGLILNIGEFMLNDFVLGAQMKSFLAAHNFRGARHQLHRRGGRADFCYGNCAGAGSMRSSDLDLARAQRPRSSPALFVWFGVYFYSGIINGVLFGIPIEHDVHRS